MYISVETKFGWIDIGWRLSKFMSFRSMMLQGEINLEARWSCASHDCIPPSRVLYFKPQSGTALMLVPSETELWAVFSGIFSKFRFFSSTRVSGIHEYCLSIVESEETRGNYLRLWLTIGTIMRDLLNELVTSPRTYSVLLINIVMNFRATTLRKGRHLGTMHWQIRLK